MYTPTDAEFESGFREQDRATARANENSLRKRVKKLEKRVKKLERRVNATQDD